MPFGRAAVTPRRARTESLRPGVDTTVPHVRPRVGRHDVSASTVPTQPSLRTFLHVALPDERADALLPEDGWSTDRQSDAAARAEVVAYGRSVGTPEHRLDRGD